MPTPNRSNISEWRAPQSGTSTPAPIRRRVPPREPIELKDLLDKLQNIEHDLLDIAAELKGLNDGHFLPVPVQPLVLSALRQSGFAADHASAALLVLRAKQGQDQ